MRLIRVFLLTVFTMILIAGTANALSFADEAVSDLLSMRIIDEIPENLNKVVTREEFCVMLSNAVLLIEPEAADTVDPADCLALFEDAADVDSYNYLSIMNLYEKGILRGALVDGLLCILPNQPVTRQDASVMLGRWLGLLDDGNTGSFRFSDDSAISGYAHSIIYQLRTDNIISGYSDGTFKPKNSISFSEAAVLIYKALGNSPEEVNTYFGSGILGNTDGEAHEARFAMPSGVCLDNDESLVVFDTYNAGVKMIRNNLAETILGFSKAVDDYGFTKAQYLDGNSDSALLGRPTDGVYAPNNDLFIADRENNAIRLLRGDTVYTFVGGIAGFADGNRNDARFNGPTAVAIDVSGNLYVADTYNHCIRKISPEGSVQTIAGTPETSGYSDGTADSALFYEPSGIAVDGRGVVYIADTGNHVIRKLEGGIVTTIAGAAAAAEDGEDYSAGGFADGSALNARFRFPKGLCCANGTLYIADTGNNCVRALSTDGIVAAIAGNGDAGDADGPKDVSMLNKPTAVAFSDGVLYIADSFNNKIKAVPVS